MSPEQANFQITDKRSDLFSVGVVLAHLLLGRNVFKGESQEESRKLVMTLPVPDFRELDKRIDERLNEILHRCLARDLNKRYPTADELLYDLEHYIYHSGYGPTNETLGKMMRALFGQNAHLAGSDTKGSTRLMEGRATRSTSRIKTK
jgi:serine/threonine-protein kinase